MKFLKTNIISGFFSFLFLCVLFFPQDSRASFSLIINNSEIPKTKILFGNTTNNKDAKKDIGQILNKIEKNLKTTNLFKTFKRDVISGIVVKDEDLSVSTVPDFPRYNAAGIDMLLVIDAGFDLEKNLEIKVRLWDVLDERQLFGKFYSSGKGNYAKMSNLISDEIFKTTTGEKSGFFDSKITYIAESGKTRNRKKRIALMDFDGNNLRYLSGGRELVLTPTFLGSDEKILFVRFHNSKAQLYNLNTQNALVKKIGSFDETTFAPSVHPKDPNIILFSVIEDGNSDIYEMNLFTNKLVRLTYDQGIDTTPSYSPDGKFIVFTSDRSGSEKIYIMNSDGTRTHKITDDRGSYSKPVWSPDGGLIAFTKMRAGQFSIGLITPDGRSEKSLTSGFLVEGAKWSPNGRYLVYSRKDGPYGKKSIPKLHVIDILSGFDRRLPTPAKEGASDPDWIMN